MRRSIYRTILIYGVLVLSLIYIYPTIGWMMLSPGERQRRLDMWAEEDLVYRKPSAWRDSWKAVRRWAQCDRDRVINLGLDLQGGIHMVLGLDIESVYDRLKAERPKWSEEDIIAEVQETALQRIERRINEFEAKEPLIQKLGTRQIQVQLPGEKDINRAKKLIMQTAFLEFYRVAGPDETVKILTAIDQHFNNNFIPLLKLSVEGGLIEVPEANFRNVKRFVDMAKDAAELKSVLQGKTVAFSRAPKPWEEDKRYRLYVLDDKPLMSGEGIQRAGAYPDDERGGWMILFQLDAASGRRFGEITEAHMYENMAIVVDGVVESAPQIRGRITTDGQITGSFTQEEAHDLSIALNSGSMPVPVREDFTGVVGASLGSDSIRKGVYSSLLGALVVVVFMVVYYRVAGIMADLALICNVVMMLAAFSYFRITLTLPGIAGFILTMGMAVDANVLIYERIREEVRNGRSLAASIEGGFAKATATILDSNITTLITGIVLMEFGSGPVQGFAIALNIGIICSVFSALVVCRAMFDLALRKKWLAKLTMMSLVPPDMRVKFMAKRRFCFMASAFLIILGMAVFAVRGGDNFGVDFQTGTNIVASLNTDRTVQVGEVRAKLAQAGFRQPTVISYEEAERKNWFLIRLSETGVTSPTAPTSPPTQGAAGEEEVDSQKAEVTTEAEAQALAGVEETPVVVTTEPGEQPTAPQETAAPAAETTVSSRVQEVLASLCTDPSQVVLEQVDTVGPAVGAQLKKDALLSLFYAFVFIVAYVWFRFELKFGVAGVVALIHDTLITAGLIAITGRQIDLPVVAALLTVVGYSINDTIVVFDRVRENLRLYRGRGLHLSEIMDISINQTLSRTLLTALTTLFVAVVLLFFGGRVVNGFAFALTVGIIVGTYSSIYVASPVALLWDRYFGKQPSRPASGEEGERASRRRRHAEAEPEEAIT